MIAFIYVWRDRTRKMFYIGSHVGSFEDGYVSSSEWLNGEIKYRSADFRRRILKILPVEQLKREEYRLINLIKAEDFGRKYYNIRCGRKKGTPASNKGKPMSEEQKAKMREVCLGRPAWNRGKKNPVAAENGRKSANKLRQTISGRKMVDFEGSRKWAYPEGDAWYVKVGKEKRFLP